MNAECTSGSPCADVRSTAGKDDIHTGSIIRPAFLIPFLLVLTAAMAVFGLIHSRRVNGPYADVFGLACKVEESSRGDFVSRIYLYDNGSDLFKPLPVAESFGWKIQAFTADIDGDGCRDLLCNCVFQGDGCQRLYIYRREGDDIFLGIVDSDAVSKLPGYIFTMEGDITTHYDPICGSIYARYVRTAAGKIRSETKHCAVSDLNISFTHYVSLAGSSLYYASYRSGVQNGNTE